MSIMQQPAVSIVVPVLNREATIVSCIQSLLELDFTGTHEIIVVDNGSIDRTRMLVERFRERVVLMHEPVRGSYRARNKGFRYARGEIIAFTDADCIADKRWLLHLTKPFEDARVRVVGGMIRAAQTHLLIHQYCDCYLHNQKRSQKADVPYFATSNMAVRKSVLTAANGFNGSFESGGDVELCARIIRDPSHSHYEARAVVWHRYSASLLNFMHKFYQYGAWCKILQKKCGIAPRVQMPSYVYLLKYHGLGWMWYRMCQDFSFHLGHALGVQHTDALIEFTGDKQRKVVQKPKEITAP